MNRDLQHDSEVQIGSLANPIIDSGLSPMEALRQNPNFLCPPEILEHQAIIPVKYRSLTDSQIHEGQIVVHESLELDVRRLFEEILRRDFVLTGVVPAADPRFNFDDNALMAANLSSGFNYRQKAGRQDMSLHSFGRAIDLNPLLNPYIKGEVVQPAGAIYDLSRPGTIGPDNFIVELMEQQGWTWGGRWVDSKDYQHFEKEG